MGNRILDYQSPRKPRPGFSWRFVWVMLFFFLPSILMALAILLMLLRWLR